MKLSDFSYGLPDHLIATRPVSPRSAARLMVAEGDAVRDLHVRDLPSVLRAGDLLVLNDTKVIPARLTGERVRLTTDGSGRARVDLTLTGPDAAGGWRALGRPLRKMRAGDRLEFDGLAAEVLAVGEDVHLAFDREGAALDAALERAGRMPLPPYIESRRAPDARDAKDYQPIWAERKGAVAAPTASLHFDDGLMAALAEAGVGTARVTLHVGAGTFLPVKVEDVTTHRMHAEWGEVRDEAVAAIAATKAAGGRVIPVGTTALRLIEAAAEGGSIAAFRGDTDIFIYPGYEFRVADGLMTNFHLPESTLLMLVSALMGRDRMLALYARAVREEYRFFSYGDASLLVP